MAEDAEGEESRQSCCGTICILKIDHPHIPSTSDPIWKKSSVDSRVVTTNEQITSMHSLLNSCFAKGFFPQRMREIMYKQGNLNAIKTLVQVNERD